MTADQDSTKPIVLITGVSRGLGAAMARGFAARAYRIAGCARPSADLESVAAELGSDSLIRPVDVSDDGAVAAFATEVVATCGVPDLLINSAAIINPPAPLWEISVEEVSALFDINVKGTIHLIRHFVPAMIERGSGVIVNFSSGWGRSTSPEVAPYCASKWAIEGLTRAFADELPRGIAAVAFNPGIIDTEMLRRCFGDSASAYPDAEEWAKAAVPYLAALGPRDNGKALTCPGH
jgi:NAD(P)-dependent dehydrogenase (short-subunit alcohol dehydrogenase family)